MIDLSPSRTRRAVLGFVGAGSLPPPLLRARCATCWFLAGLAAMIVASFWTLELQ